MGKETQGAVVPELIWSVTRIDYNLDHNAKSEVLVTDICWRAVLLDGALTATRYGKLTDDQDRVYELSLLGAVAEADIVEWAKLKLGVDEVAAIKADLYAQIAEKVAPATGRIIYKDFKEK